MANDTNKTKDIKIDENIDDATMDELNSNAQSADPYSREEYAAEVAPNVIDLNRREKETVRPDTTERDLNEGLNVSETNVDDVTGGRGIAGLALALSILSLFVMPIILGAAGIIIGFIARRRGATTLGAWAIGIGAVSIIVGLFILPFF
jgi:hypothetical protein